MALVWPLALPQFVNQSGFSLDVGDTTIKSSVDVGPAKRRRISTRSVDTLTVSMDIDYTQYQMLYDFFNTSLNGGINSFLFNHPITTIPTEFRFIEPLKFSAKGGTYFVVSMKWEQII